jgi:hypothetical protein
MTTTGRRKLHRWPASAVCALAFAFLRTMPARAQMPTSPTERTLSGRVTGAGNEPIRGAVVELRNERSSQIVTYITDATGAYTFKRLDGNTDYDVWVLFRGHPSPTRTISKFDDHMAKVIDFTVRTY